MKKREIQDEVSRRLLAGETKSSVFKLLCSRGAKARVAAHLIASYADPKLLDRYSKLIDAMIIISWLQVAIAVLIGLGFGLKHGLGAGLFFTGFVGAFTYLFVWGFTHNKAWAYNATILLSVINLPKAFIGFAEDPITSAIALFLSLALVLYTWYVRSKLFPDFAFVSPKKFNGSFVFSN